MPDALFSNGFVRTKCRVCETVYLLPLRVGESHVELKVEIYEMSDGFFSAAVFALEFFNLENTPVPPFKSSEKGVVALYVRDEFYDTTSISARSPSEALQTAFQTIHNKLSGAGCDIEVL